MNRASIPGWWAQRSGVEWLAPAGLLAAIGLLSVFFPLSIWAASDYSLDSLSGAINLAYRFGDRTFYPAPSMGNHPGVPQYLVSWLSLALSGFPIATSDARFFDQVLDHAELFRSIAVVLFTLCELVAFTRWRLRRGAGFQGFWCRRFASCGFIDAGSSDFIYPAEHRCIRAATDRVDGQRVA